MKGIFAKGPESERQKDRTLEGRQECQMQNARRQGQVKDSKPMSGMVRRVVELCWSVPGASETEGFGMEIASEGGL